MTQPNYVRRALATYASYGDAEALVANDGRRFSFTELVGRIDSTAAALFEHGVRPGMTIGVLVTNPAESYFVQLGAHLLGCRTVFMAHTTPPYFLRSVLGFINADAFIYEVAHIGALGQELAQAASPLLVLCIGADGLGPDLTDPPAVTKLPFDADAIGTEPVSLFQTSGSTGTPKLVQHGDRFFRSIPTVAKFYRPPQAPMRHLLYSSSWHSGAQSAALMTWGCGGTVVMRFGFNIEVILQTMSEERITSTMLSSPILYQLLDDPRITEVDLSHMYQLTVSTSPTSPARLREAISYFGDALNVVYGMSELPFITVLPEVATASAAQPELLASCGRAWGDVRLEIRDEYAQALPPHEVGEICVASDLATEGYFGSPEITAESLVDGWLRTGDVGRLDGDGNLYIVDRLKDMILTDVSSTVVYCRPLEDALTEHPEVRQAAVVGVPDPRFGEAAHAYVVRAPGASVTAEELRQLVVDSLNAQWSPREVEFVDALPLTGGGKIDKPELRARYLASHQPARSE